MDPSRPAPGAPLTVSTALAMVLALAASAGCGPCPGPDRPPAAGPAAPPPNLVVVLIDTLRADHTGLHGYRRDTTPELRRIAADGLVLRRHLVNAPWTKPSVASILTGLHPSAHGARLGHAGAGPRGRRIEVLSPALTTLPEALTERGYATAAWITNAHLRADWGFGQGYSRYAFREKPVPHGGMPAVDRGGIDFAIDALRRAERPVFVWTHLMAVHQYESPAGSGRFTADDPAPIDRRARHAWRVRRYPDLGTAVAAYDDAVRATDAEVGRLFDAVRALAPNTVLVVTSDHGEEFYDHGGFDHGETLYDELLWVPCVLWGPGVPRGAAIDGLTDSLDLYPTLLALAGGGGSGPGPGRPLLRDGAPAAGKAETLAEQHALGRFRRFSVLDRDGRKLIVSERRRSGEVESIELYADGHRVEGVGLDPDLYPATVERLRGRIAVLRARAEAFRAGLGGAAEERTLDPEDLERLRALGYLR